MNLREILQRREAIRAELRGIIDQHTDGNLPDEARTRADTLEAEAVRLNDMERRQVLIDELDRRASGQPLISTDTGFDTLAAQVTILDVIRAQMGGTDAACGRAREVSAELERRSGRKAEGLFFDMRMSGTRKPEQRVYTTGMPTPGGGALIQTDVSPNLIDRLREKIIVRRLGATVLAGLVGNLNIPRLKASATGYWVAENQAITASDPQTDAVSLTPKHVGGIVEISRNMIMQPSLDVAAMVENDLAKIIAVALDSVAIMGGGTNQPHGLLATGSGINLVPMGGAPTWAGVVALIEAVDVANALEGALGFATNAKAVAKMRQTLKTSADTASNFIMNDASTLAGYPLASSQIVPSNLGAGTSSSAIIFGDWSMLILGFWSELDILANPYESTAYSKGNVQIRAMATADVAIKQPLAFAAATDVTATMATATAAPQHGSTTSKAS